LRLSDALDKEVDKRAYSRRQMLMSGVDRMDPFNILGVEFLEHGNKRSGVYVGLNVKPAHTGEARSLKAK
jgi:hypothetical protein